MKHIVVLSGEPSGDALIADLLRSLREKLPDGGRDLRVTGIGGEQSVKAGLVPIFDSEQLSIIGVVQALKHLPNVLRLRKQFVDHVLAVAPDLVVTADLPDFSLMVAKGLRRRKWQGRLVHYVAPTVWIWRAGRAQSFARSYDIMLTLFPFETRLFGDLPCYFVGHPLLRRLQDYRNNHRELVAGDGHREGAAPRASISLCLLPGSRRKEVALLLPILIQTANQLHRMIPALEVIIPTIKAREDTVRDQARSLSMPCTVPTAESDRFRAFLTCDAAIGASGTVVTEACVAGIPIVNIYKTSKANVWLGKRLLHVPFISVVNILARQKIVEEIVNDDLTDAALIQAISPFLGADRAEKRRSWQQRIAPYRAMITGHHDEEGMDPT
nr:lipid-A-disaccharide synthase [Alphaproteobacteria bacterium]